MADHPIFDDIDRNDLEAVKQHVLADSAVLEERTIGWGSCTPLCYAIREQKTAIAHWLIEHRGKHDIGTQARQARCPLHLACYHGPLSVVQALVAAGPNSIALDIGDCTPMIYAVEGGHTDTVAYLLQLPIVRNNIDIVEAFGNSALSRASYYGRQVCVQLLLNAGADPTIPRGDSSRSHPHGPRTHSDSSSPRHHGAPSRPHSSQSPCAS